jgi:hypothetical protein
MLENIYAAVKKLVGKSQVEAGTDESLNGTKIVITLDNANVKRGLGTNGDGTDEYKQTIALSPIACLATAIQYSGIQGDNIRNFLIEAYRLSREQQINGRKAVADLFDDKDKSDKFEAALAEVAKLTDTLDGNRKTKTMVDIGNATVEVYNRNGELVEQSVAS